ncbi:alpha-ketoglutarate-dependent dioxygenase AlkB [Pseudoalteromonas piscicida]|uniref:alpha-ketoglutarate-dependent dioxygenase AlkB n=1 Tax=Pseudoalteromonas piscicida TaxID=43662 RepID=UPI001C981205|nr:alpha-ketoglutarate-dependent dioxygenase AlkB [Pseudoalteromonas piscicida]QZO15320.1 alpha-ketoglutarate-dependent dioxygenase AlkB [Pseudoalteromonas piscicida]
MKLPLIDNAEAEYIPAFLTKAESHSLYQWLIKHCDLSQPEIITLPNGENTEIRPWKMMFVEPRLEDPAVFPSYHGRRQTWPDLIALIQQRLQTQIGIEFSVCVCIFYPDGEEYMDFHSDLSAFGPTNVIASLSLGAERLFQVRHQENPDEQFEQLLEDGSLFIMGNGFQTQFQHAVPPAPKEIGARFNLTFRQFAWPNIT